MGGILAQELEVALGGAVQLLGRGTQRGLGETRERGLEFGFDLAGNLGAVAAGQEPDGRGAQNQTEEEEEGRAHTGTPACERAR